MEIQYPENGLYIEMGRSLPLKCLPSHLWQYTSRNLFIITVSWRGTAFHIAVPLYGVDSPWDAATHIWRHCNADGRVILKSSLVVTSDGTHTTAQLFSKWYDYGVYAIEFMFWNALHFHNLKLYQ